MGIWIRTNLASIQSERRLQSERETMQASLSRLAGLGLKPVASKASTADDMLTRLRGLVKNETKCDLRRELDEVSAEIDTVSQATSFNGSNVLLPAPANASAKVATALHLLGF